MSRGQGPDAAPVLIKVGADGKIGELPSRTCRSPRPYAADADTKTTRVVAVDRSRSIAFVNNRVSSPACRTRSSPSKLRSIPFPFTEADKAPSVEIYHGSHGRSRRAARCAPSSPYKIDGETHLLAAYTCTPLVKLPVADLKPGEKVKGTTIAELGNMNRPLDMIVYTKDGKDYILMANSARGVMKIPTEGIDKVEASPRGQGRRPG